MDISKKKGRKRSSDPQKWRQNINKVLRNTGNSYESKKKETVPPRQVKPPCTERCRLKCSEKFTSVQRQALFAAFWAIGDIDKQRLFINSCMSNVSPRYKYTNALHPRQSNKAFHFVMDGKTIRVCKTFFIATLNISDRVIRTVKQKCDKLGIIQCDPRGKHNNHRTNDESLILDIKKFIDAIPRIESHYTRQTSTREYIDGAKSIKDIFKDFKESQEKNNKPYGKYCTFYNIFTKEYNISFYYPRKDQCDLCLQYANSNNEQKNLMRGTFDAHLEEKTLSRQDKYNDRCKINENNKVLVFDLQAVLQSPRGNTSAFFYKSKLNSYNFTITLLNQKVDGQMRDSDVHAYFWNETDAKRGANEIGSCLLDCFDKICQESRLSDGDGLNLILYSDNCTGQNKNKYIVALYLYAVTHLNIASITHKFLIKGHTQNEGDNAHSLIEKEIKKNLKSGPIYCPHQYVTMIKNAKKTGQKFFVHECTYDSFLDLKKASRRLGIQF
ncbi:uncharacterized protein LOC119837403 isoform X1 [Zerene cesonia]|uniref:uncharacterized protein LOC119837403 isoform X1 n=1 Tax=Zerene cesonia TaxID=33412 RepID=UPI0018E4F494|nr:uncharacterized protein LOC119837403 isoform X1 [Zerene cesonia]